MSKISDELITAYQSTAYEVYTTPPFTLFIGRYSAPLEKLLKQQQAVDAAFITACNPYSQLLPSSENDKRNQCLAKQLEKQQLTFMNGAGRAQKGHWPAEASFLVLGLSLQQAKSLAAQYQQNALLWTDNRAIPQLVALR